MAVQRLRENKKPPPRARRHVQLADVSGEELPAPVSVFPPAYGDDEQAAHEALHKPVSEVRAAALDNGGGSPLILTDAAWAALGPRRAPP